MVLLIFKSSTKTQTASQEQLPVQHTNRQHTPVTITNPSYLPTCQQVSQAFSPHFLLQPQDQRYHKESMRSGEITQDAFGFQLIKPDHMCPKKEKKKMFDLLFSSSSIQPSV